MTKGDPIVGVFGKDIADLIYRWKYRLMLLDINKEYCELCCFNQYCVQAGVALRDPTRFYGFVFNYRRIDLGLLEYQPDIQRWKRCLKTWSLPKGYC